MNILKDEYFVMENNQENKEKKVSIVHLIYLSIIFVIIILTMIFAQQSFVCEVVFNNFSFAATITSIVLAVVSIMYSLQSGSNAISNVGTIKNIEGKILEQLGEFRNLREEIGNSLERQTCNIGQTIKESVESINLKTESLFVDCDPETWEIILLYYCKRAKEYSKKEIDVEVLTSLGLNRFYLNGYLYALKKASLIDFYFDGDKMYFNNIDDKLDVDFGKNIDNEKLQKCLERVDVFFLDVMKF